MDEGGILELAAVQRQSVSITVIIPNQILYVRQAPW